MQNKGRMTYPGYRAPWGLILHPLGLAGALVFVWLALTWELAMR